MANDPDLLERTVEKVRELPLEKLRVLDEFIDELAAEAEFHQLSTAELAILDPALERARMGRFASDDEVTRALGRLVK